MKLHLDSEYKNRWEEYHLFDGSVKDSRKINWRKVKWEKVERIVFYIKDKKHILDRKGKKNFKGFMRFRWGGREAQYNAQGQFIGYKPIHIWTLGWTNGKIAFLKDFDFKTGVLIKTYQMKLKDIKSHIHPRLKLKI